MKTTLFFATISAAALALSSCSTVDDVGNGVLDATGSTVNGATNVAGTAVNTAGNVGGGALNTTGQAAKGLGDTLR